MPELVRDIVDRLWRLIGNRRHARRHDVRLAVTVTLHDLKRGADSRRNEVALEGVTRDISSTGLSLVLPAVRIGDRYLAGEGQLLRVRLEHPTGPLELIARPARYERLDDGDADIGYEIGVHIIEVADEDRARLIEHLRQLEK